MIFQIAVASICIFVILPLTLVGTVLGRNLAGTPDYPCRINAVPRYGFKRFFNFCQKLHFLSQKYITEQFFLLIFYSRPIPEKKWFMEPLVIIPLGGVLPFGSIFIEMYFIFTSFWAYKIYYVYGFMLLVFFILAVVTICVTIVCTYFLLNAEDYRWYVSKIISEVL